MQLKLPRRFQHSRVLVVGIATAAFTASVFAAMQMPMGAQHVHDSTTHLVDVCTSRDPGESDFAAENDAAMTKMMAAMAIKPSDDIDRDFAAMMIPHHQGAIEMAQAELRHGRNEQLRRIAQEIIVEQQQEIAAMHLALDQPLPPSAPAPTQTSRQ